MSSPPYASQQASQSFVTNTPPAPPPKPSGHEGSRRSTPAGSQSLSAPPQQDDTFGTHGRSLDNPPAADHARTYDAQLQQQSQDPGEQWLPKILEDKSKPDLAGVLANPKLLAALAHAASTAHPSVAASQEPLQAALKENIALAGHLNQLETQLTHLRSSTQAQLLSAHVLERQWRQKQSEMDRALSSFSPSSLYQRLSQGVQEQEQICRALEESFLEGDGNIATEREITEWVKRYRDAKKVYYARQERKERWDEGRVGGWR